MTDQPTEPTTRRVDCPGCDGEFGFDVDAYLKYRTETVTCPLCGAVFDAEEFDAYGFVTDQERDQRIALEKKELEAARDEMIRVSNQEREEEVALVEEERDAQLQALDRDREMDQMEAGLFCVMEDDFFYSRGWDREGLASLAATWAYISLSSHKSHNEWQLAFNTLVDMRNECQRAFYALVDLISVNSDNAECIYRSGGTEMGKTEMFDRANAIHKDFVLGPRITVSINQATDFINRLAPDDPFRCTAEMLHEVWTAYLDVTPLDDLRSLIWSCVRFGLRADECAHGTSSKADVMNAAGDLFKCAKHISDLVLQAIWKGKLHVENGKVIDPNPE